MEKSYSIEGSCTTQNDLQSFKTDSCKVGGSGLGKVILTSCINRVRAIGLDNDLIYTLPKDMKRFRNITNNNVVIMGYNTFKSLPKGPLPNRVNVVIADGNPDLGNNVKVFEKLTSAIEYCRATYLNKDIYIIGGGRMYWEGIDLASEMDLTIVDDYVKGDVYFPKYYEDEWQLKEQRYIRDNGYDTYHCRYVRVNVSNNGFLNRHFNRVMPTDDWHEEWVSKDDKFMIKKLDDKYYEFVTLTSNINSDVVKRFERYNLRSKYEVRELVELVRNIYEI